MSSDSQEQDRAPDRVRRPIGAKIFGITVFLLLLMAAVTYTSTRNLKQLNHQLEILSAHYIPLDQAIAEVRASHLNQILLFERLVPQRPDRTLDQYADDARAVLDLLQPCDAEKQRAANSAARKAHPAGAARNAVLYAVARTCGDHGVDAAEGIVRSALELPAVRSDADQAARLSALAEQLRHIRSMRGELHETLAAYLAELRGRADARAIEILKEQLDENRRNVGRETGAIARLLHGYTQDAAQHANGLERRAFAFTWGVTIAATVLGLLFAAVLTRNLLRPVRDLLSGAKAIEQGNLDINVRVTSADELALLARSFNFMVSGLREKESIKATFGKYMDPRIVQSLLEERPLASAGEKREMSVFFSDIEGFTTICEELTPDAVVRLLNHYFSRMSEPILANRGIVDKYIGDAVMAFWGPPFTEAGEHATLACQAALDQVDRLAAFRASLPDVTGLRRGLPGFNLRVGISTGPVTVGSIGSESTRSYTVIGDTANLASRLESVNKQYGTRIIISEDTRHAAAGAIEVRELDRIRVAGKREPARIFELLGRKGRVDAATLQLRDRFEQGLEAWRERRWDEADRHFDACLALRGDDGPARLFRERLVRARAEPPGADWDGVWTFTGK